MSIDGLSGFEPIGSGGFADVYRARDDFDRLVAVKVLKALDEAGRRRFDRELAAMGRVAGHPHVVVPFTSGYTDEADSRPYLVMEYLPGGSLQQRLDTDGPLPVAEAVELMVLVAGALQHSHGAGIVHKDVKPANVLLTAEGVPKLADFGIASVRDATQTALIAYSPEYTPPELFHASGSAHDPRDERSDLYSLACTLYAVVVGRGPFHSPTNTSPAGYMKRILEDPPPSVDHRGLDEFLATAMAKDPEHRYPNAAQFIHALQTIKNHPLGTATVPVPGPPTAPPSSASVPTTQPLGLRDHRSRPDLQSPDSGSEPSIGGEKNEAGGHHRRVPGRAVLLGLGAIAAIAIAIGLITRNDGNPLATYTGHFDRPLPAFSVVELGNGQIASTNGYGVRIWDSANPDTTVAIYREPVSSVAGMANGNLVSGLLDGTVQIWDPADPDTIVTTYTGHTTADLPTYVSAVLELANGNIASGGSDGTVHIWDPADPDTTISVYTEHVSSVGALAQLANGDIASAGWDGREGEVRIWDPSDPNTTISVYTATEPETESQISSNMYAVVELDNGNIASSTGDASVQIWDPADRYTTIAIRPGLTSAVAGLANSNIVSGMEDGTVQIWDPADPENTIATYTGHTAPFPGPVAAVTELSNGNIASAGYNKTVQIWDPDSL